jgi:hypothetical protein
MVSHAFCGELFRTTECISAKRVASTADLVQPKRNAAAKGFER